MKRLAHSILFSVEFRLFLSLMAALQSILMRQEGAGKYRLDSAQSIKLRIRRHEMAQTRTPQFVAEISANHNGCLHNAKKFAQGFKGYCLDSLIMPLGDHKYLLNLDCIKIYFSSAVTLLNFTGANLQLFFRNLTVN